MSNPTFYGGRRINAYADNILVELDTHRDSRDPDRCTAGGIIIPRTAETSDVWATVISAGPGAPDEPIDHATDKQTRSKRWVPMVLAVLQWSDENESQYPNDPLGCAGAALIRRPRDAARRE